MRLHNEIEQLSVTFGPGLGASLWTYNTNLLQSIIVGMHENDVVVGVKIDDGGDIKGIGTIEVADGKYLRIDNGGEKRDLVEKQFFLNLIGHEFPIIYTDDRGVTMRRLGTGEIYSSSAVIYERVKHGFMLIIVNSVIKTLALWFIFIYFTRRILGRPLTNLTLATKEMDLDNLNQVHIDVPGNSNNELKQLQDAFNGMVDEIVHGQK